MRFPAPCAVHAQDGLEAATEGIDDAARVGDRSHPVDAAAERIEPAPHVEGWRRHGRAPQAGCGLAWHLLRFGTAVNLIHLGRLRGGFFAFHERSAALKAAALQLHEQNAGQVHLAHRFATHEAEQEEPSPHAMEQETPQPPTPPVP